MMRHSLQASSAVGAELHTTQRDQALQAGCPVVSAHCSHSAAHVQFCCACPPA